ncbi:MAG: sigma factor-like helix-turn-helix DNA-binding protein [Bacillota bacterium]|nr:sigma factor-like helix-turn-helix DNA-binding protein [Bacillota bacterium]
MSKDGLNKKVNYGMLAEFYAPLLTDRQQTLIELYCDEDLSLSEIAGQLSISRQAVSDNLNRAYERLDELENHLKLYQSFILMRGQLERCRALLNQVEATESTRTYLKEAIDALNEGIDRKGGKDGI